MTAYRSAQAASRDLFEFFIDCHPVFEGINLQEVRQLEDRISVIAFYLQEKRRQLHNERRRKADEHHAAIRHGHLGNHLPSYGAGPDYELPAGEGDGQLVEVTVRRLSFGSPSRMLLG